MRELTDRQAEVMRVFRELHELYGSAPTSREMADVMGISRTAIDQHVTALVRKGSLTKRPGVNRGLKEVAL